MYMSMHCINLPHDSPIHSLPYLFLKQFLHLLIIILVSPPSVTFTGPCKASVHGVLQQTQQLRVLVRCEAVSTEELYTLQDGYK